MHGQRCLKPAVVLRLFLAHDAHELNVTGLLELPGPFALLLKLAQELLLTLHGKLPFLASLHLALRLKLAEALKLALLLEVALVLELALALERLALQELLPRELAWGRGCDGRCGGTGWHGALQ